MASFEHQSTNQPTSEELLAQYEMEWRDRPHTLTPGVALSALRRLTDLARQEALAEQQGAVAAMDVPKSHAGTPIAGPNQPIFPALGQEQRQEELRGEQ